MYVLNGNSKEISELFKPFGLSEYEARVYFTLQVCGKTGAGELSKKSGVPQTKIYQIIPALEVRGLVEVIPKFPKEVRAKPFLRFANDYLTKRKCLLDEIGNMIKEQKEAMKKMIGYVQVLG